MPVTLPGLFLTLLITVSLEAYITSRTRVFAPGMTSPATYKTLPEKYPATQKLAASSPYERNSTLPQHAAPTTLCWISRRLKQPTASLSHGGRTVYANASANCSQLKPYKRISLFLNVPDATSATRPSLATQKLPPRFVLRGLFVNFAADASQHTPWCYVHNVIRKIDK